MGVFASVCRGACAAALALLLASCGGGGGGSSGGGSGGGGAPTGSLVPPAGPPGAVLFTDATVLRPLATGATLTYRGRDVAYTGAAPVVYTNVVSQSAVGAGFQEQATNAFNAGADAIGVSVVGGTVLSVSPLDLSTGGVSSSQSVELRSPVRQNDQYTLLEQHIADVGADGDGDGRNEAADVAIYRVVVGIESITPENLPPLQAVRVDMIGLVRITFSRDGSSSGTVLAATQSTWYAAGIGVVRQRLTVPNSATSDHVGDEVIVAWDGLTQGFGAMSPVPAVVSGSSAAMPGVSLRGPSQGFLGAVGFADHALVFSNDTSSFTGTLVSWMDKRGNVLSAKQHSGLTVNATLGRLVGHQTGAIYLEPSGAQLSLTRFDADGNLLGTVGGTSFDFGGGRVGASVQRFEVASDGANVWVLCSRSYTNVGVGLVNELVLQQMDSNGNAAAAEIVVDTGSFANASVSAGGGRVAVAWTKGTGGGYAEQYAFAQANSTVLSVFQMATMPGPNSFVTPLVFDQGGALLWPAALGSGLPIANAAGVRVDAAGAILRTTAGQLDTEQLAGVLPFFSNNPGAVAIGSRLVITSGSLASLWSDDSSTQWLDWVTWLDADAGPLASRPSHSVRTPASASGGGGLAPSAVKQVVWPDRALLFGGDFQLRTTVVWLNSGS